MTPGQIDPDGHFVHGVAPRTGPQSEAIAVFSEKKPEPHAHELCSYEPAGEWLFEGHLLATPDLHQNPATHAVQLLPTYPPSQAQGHVGPTATYDARSGLFVQ